VHTRPPVSFDDWEPQKVTPVVERFLEEMGTKIPFATTANGLHPGKTRKWNNLKMRFPATPLDTDRAEKRPDGSTVGPLGALTAALSFERD